VSDDLTSCFQVIVELRMRKREMRGYEGNNHETLRLERISPVSQVTISDTARMSPDPACNYSDSSSSHTKQGSRTPDFSYRLQSSTVFSSSSRISLFLVHNSTIITEHNVKSLLSISPCHDHEVRLSTAYI